MKRQNILLLLACVAITVAPLLFIKSGDEKKEIFTGADGQAEGVISKISPDYKPWFEPFWEPPSGEIEGLLFGLQAAIGAGLIGYCIGFYRGRGAAKE